MHCKRFAAALMAALCTLSVSSCGKKENENSNKEENATTEQTPSAETTNDTEVTTAETTDDVKNGENEDTSANILDYVTVDKATPAMWKVTDPETGNVLYMLGTMHMITEDTFPLPDYIMNVYDKCDGVAVEVDTSEILGDMNKLQDFYSKLVYTDGTTVKDHISDETYEKLKKYMTDNYMYNEVMDSYTAGYWASQVEAVSVTSIKKVDVNGVDARFIEMAHKDSKEVISIENIDIQVDALTAASDELADYMISGTIDKALDMPTYTKEFAEEYDKWASGDIDALDFESEADEELPSELEDDFAEYADIMLYNRNGGMAEKAEEFLKNGKNYFFMVGAAHFAGDKGVDDILESKGYKVERVSA